MNKKSKRLLSWLVLFFMMASFMVNISKTTSAAPQSTKPIEVVLAADAVSNNLDLTGFSDSLKADLSARYGIPSSRVYVSSVDSTVYSDINSFSWKRFDHTNTNATVNDANNYVVQYTDPYVTNITSTHVQIAGDGKSITFLGYGMPAFKDFLFTSNSNANNKVFNFTLNEGQVDYHTLDGAGFLFGSKYSYDNSTGNRRLSGYAVLMGASDAGIYEFNNIDVGLFTQETSQTVVGSVTTPNVPVNMWSGTVKLLSKTTKPASVGGLRYLKLVASPTSASLYQFTDATYNTTSSVVFSNITLPDNFGSFGFGPIASYQSHGCSVQTKVTYSNITMQEDTSVGFADLVRSTNWKYSDSMKLFVNVDNDGVTDFSDPAKYSSILYYMMLNNAHYIGWGINNTISSGTVKSEADGLTARNNSKGTFINRSNAATDSLSEGITVISDYIANNLDNESTIDKPSLNTTFSGAGQVTCSTPDTVTSKGNVISSYEWRVLNVVTGSWQSAAGTSSTSLTFPQGTYSIVTLRIKDSATGEWSEYASSYVANVANVAPVSQFKLNTSFLMPDTSVSALRTGTVVGVTDTSYVPNGSGISNWEWTVLDSSLQPVPALGKTYSSSTKPSSISFDFNGLSGGSYSIRLRTQNSNGDWSAYYSQKLTVYKESNTITITTSENNSSTIVYSGTRTVPFTVTSSGQNITSYRTIKILKGQNSRGDWTKVNSSSVSANTAITDEACDLYVQALDAAGNSKTQFIGRYSILANVSSYYAGTVTNYVNNTPTNKDVTFTSGSNAVEYSKDGGTTWSDLNPPMTVSTAGTYTFRGYGDTNSQNYVTKVVNINKVFSGNIDSVTDGGKYRDDMTINTTGITATLSKNGGTQTPFVSGTTLTDEGSYSLVGTDIYGNTKAYNFIIDKTLPVINTSGNAADWTKNDVVLNISKIVGPSGVGSVTVIKDGDAPIDITSSTTYTVSSNGKYTFTVTNGAGASNYVVVDVTKIDKTAPTVSVDSVKSGNKDYVYSAIIPSENNITVSLSNPNTVESGVKYYYSTNSGQNWNLISGDNITIAETGNVPVTYSFKSVSNSGIESNIINKNVYIIKPGYTGDIQNAVTTSNGADYTGAWTNKDIKVALTGGINDAAYLKYQYSTNPSDEASWKDMTGDRLNELTISSDQNTKYYFRAASKGGSYSPVTEGMNVKLDKTAPTDTTVTLKENSFKSFLNSISFNLFFKDSLDVNVTANSDISGINHYEYQVVEDGTGKTYSENGPWETYDSLQLNRQFKGVVYVRTVDNAGNISNVVSSDGFIIDSVKPTTPVITAVTSGKPYASSWVASDIDVVLSNSTAFSDISRYQYKIGVNGTWTDMPLSSSGQLKDKLTITQNSNDLYYFRAVSKSGIYSEENSLMIRHDIAKPALKLNSTGTVNNWTNDSVKFDFANTNSNNISPVSYYIKLGTDDWKSVKDTTYSFTSDVNTTAQFKAVSASGVESTISPVYNIMIDKTSPVITGASEKSIYSIGKIVNFSDAFGEIKTSTYQKDNGEVQNLTASTLISIPGSYSISVVDKAGNKASLNFTIKALPGVNDVVYTPESKTAIDAIREELNNTKGLQDPYASEINASVKKLEDRYAALDSEVKSLKSQTADLMSTITKLPNEKDGLIALQDKLQNLYDAMAGSNSDLTVEQKGNLVNEKAYLIEKLNILKGLKDQVTSVSDQVTKIPASDDGLIAQQANINALLTTIKGMTQEQQKLLSDKTEALNKMLSKISDLNAAISDYKTKIGNISENDEGLIASEGKIQELLSGVSSLTTEQQKALATQVAKLNKLLSRIAVLKAQVSDVQSDIKALPEVKNVKKEDASKVNAALDKYDALSKEQQSLVGTDLVNKLNGLVEEIKKLMLTNEPNAVTITGVDGTSFSADTILKVDPIKQESNKTQFVSASGSVDKAAKTNTKLNKKELVALYDISILKNNVKIQPDGKVQVKIKIPDNLKKRINLDIVHIADDGTVNTMNATSDGKYLTFITTHFSMYGIVATDTCVFGICKALGIYEATGGICYDWAIIISGAVILGGLGLGVYGYKRRKRNLN